MNPHGNPMTAAAFYVLLSLSGHERDPAAIVEDVALSSAGRVRLDSRSLRGNIQRLLHGGLIERIDHRLYRLTHDGRKALAAELERMEHALHVARGRGRQGTLEES